MAGGPSFLVSWRGASRGTALIEARRFYIGRIDFNKLSSEKLNRVISAGCDDFTVCIYDEDMNNVINTGLRTRVISRSHLVVEAVGSDHIRLYDHGAGRKGSALGTLVYGDGRWFYLRGEAITLRRHVFIQLGPLLSLHVYRLTESSTIWVDAFETIPTPVDDNLLPAIRKQLSIESVGQLQDTLLLLVPKHAGRVIEDRIMIGDREFIVHIDVHSPNLTRNVTVVLGLLHSLHDDARREHRMIKNLCSASLDYEKIQSIIESVAYKVRIIRELITILKLTVQNLSQNASRLVGVYEERIKQIQDKADKLCELVDNSREIPVLTSTDACSRASNIMKSLADTLSEFLIKVQELLPERHLTQIVFPRAGVRVELKRRIAETEHSEIFEGVVIEGEYAGKRVVVKMPKECGQLVEHNVSTKMLEDNIRKCKANTEKSRPIMHREYDLARKLREKLGKKADELFRLPLMYGEYDLDYLSGGFKIPVLIYEYCESTLRDELGRLRDGNTNIVVDALLAVADALKELHEIGITHLDVREANIFLCGGRWKLGDLDAAIETGHECITIRLHLAPPPEYIPPELEECIKGGACTVCPSADTYMLILMAASLLKPEMRNIVVNELRSPGLRPLTALAKYSILYFAGLLRGYRLVPHPDAVVKPNTIVITPQTMVAIKRSIVASSLDRRISSYITERGSIAILRIDSLGLLRIEYTPCEKNNGFMVCSSLRNECVVCRNRGDCPSFTLSPGDLLGVAVTCSDDRILERLVEPDIYKVLSHNKRVLEREGFRVKCRPLLLFRVEAITRGYNL